VEWEGSDAVEECTDTESNTLKPKVTLEPDDSDPPEPEIPSESDVSSEDEYVADREKSKGKGGAVGKVRSMSVVPFFI
jgi:hypothetical protein